MSFQAYLNAVEAKTGKSPDALKALAAAKGLAGPGVKAGDVVAWLKDEFDLGRGHAMAIFALLKADVEPRGAAGDRIDKLFSGGRASLRPLFDAVAEKAKALGDDVDLAPTDTYVSLVRGTRKFAIVQPVAGRLDIGVKRKAVAPTERFAAAGSWNSMVTHRSRLTDAAEIDAELVEWLWAAYAAA
ncbi:DUF4287 domain-containing protein [Caulobacter segnis]|uniref:DUF4287 domain-containing protein n=1 Tax=Caulobacter segnis TaxID=88688 RepID=UPI00241067A4|nr:DUF4287 domain-containing protein [Caulobacter segnis]MDG2523457.1 DUF4287 domain-containing protein [Caulobacter segnis]